LSTANSFSD